MLSTENIDLTDLVDAKEACRILGGIDYSTLYRGIADGRFSRPVKLGKFTSRWVRAELIGDLRRLAAEREAPHADAA